VRLGWHDENIEIVDEDQGHSGAIAEKSNGFQQLVSEFKT